MGFGMPRLVLGGAVVLALAGCSLASAGLLTWVGHVFVIAAAGYLYTSVPGTAKARAAAISPGVSLSTAHAWSIPFQSMLSRLPGLAGSPDLPPLWANGGIALPPILVFSVVQIWLITATVPMASRDKRSSWKSAWLAAALVTMVSVVSGGIAILVGGVLSQLSVERALFPPARYSYFGLFWFSVNLALIHSPLAVIGGLIVRRVGRFKPPARTFSTKDFDDEPRH